MINPIHVHNVGELSRNYLPYKIMKEFIVVSDHLPVKLVEKVLGKESRILFIGNTYSHSQKKRQTDIPFYFSDVFILV